MQHITKMIKKVKLNPSVSENTTAERSLMRKNRKLARSKGRSNKCMTAHYGTAGGEKKGDVAVVGYY